VEYPGWLCTRASMSHLFRDILRRSRIVQTKGTLASSFPCPKSPRTLSSRSILLSPYQNADRFCSWPPTQRLSAPGLPTRAFPRALEVFRRSRSPSGIARVFDLALATFTCGAGSKVRLWCCDGRRVFDNVLPRTACTKIDKELTHVLLE